VASSGTLAAGNSVGTMTIIGNLVQDGGSFDVEFDQSGVDLWTVSGAATLLNTPALNIMALNGASSVTGVILHADGGITGSFADPPIYSGNGSASVQQTANDVILNVISGTPVAADHHASLQTGLSFFHQLDQEQVTGCAGSGQWLPSPRGCRGRLWTKGFGQLGEEDAHDGNKAFAYGIGGVAMGMEADLGERSFGASLGYSSSYVEVAGEGSATTIGSVIGALYATFRQADSFLTATIGGGSQDLDLFRTAIVGGETFEVEAESRGKLLGGSLRTGVTLEPGEGWTLTPSARLSYLHQWVAAYEEDLDTISVAIDDHDNGLLQVAGEIEARHRRMIDETVLSPHLTLGIIGDVSRGGTANGTFSTGNAFSLSLYEAERLRALAGLGLEAELANGSTARLSYKGEASQDGFAHSLMGEVRLLW
jgi:outer membrane autotransporter protein